MPSWQVALIRGINVGRAKRVSMADLRSLVEELGFGNVKTLLNSGNVVYTTRTAPATAATRIEKALATATGVAARVTVLTGDELAAAVTENPLLKIADNPSRLLVAVLNDRKDSSKLTALMSQNWSPDVLAIGTRVAYLWCASGILESKLAEAVSRTLGDAVTTRNWATIQKLHAQIEPK